MVPTGSLRHAVSPLSSTCVGNLGLTKRHRNRDGDLSCQQRGRKLEIECLYPNVLSSCRLFFHYTSIFRYPRMNTVKLARPLIDSKQSTRDVRTRSTAQGVGPVEPDSFVSNGGATQSVGMEDFNSDLLSLDQESNQRYGPNDVARREGTAATSYDGEKMLAAVDMGTNSFHMVVVRADKQGRFELVDTEKEDVRLGSGSPDLSVISPDAEERALVAMKRFRKLAQTRNAEMRVVATSAVREARNRRTFVRRVLEVAGVEVEVLSGTEEACLIYQGVLQALPVYNSTVLVVDIGGGSTEFVLGKAGKPIYATSLKLGHIRLSEQFLNLGQRKDELKKEQIEELRRHIRVILADSGVVERVQGTPFDLAIGSSGTIESIEQMIYHTATTSNDSQVVDPNARTQQNTSSLRDREFKADELNLMVKKVCKAKTVEQRARIPGLPEKRADVIVGGAVLLEEIFMAMGIQKMKVSPYALREGVIVDTLSETFANYRPGFNIRSSSITNLAMKFNTDRRMESAQHSARLAKEILAGLQTSLNGHSVSEVALLLNEDDAELLEAATALHYVGMFVNHKSYHRHSHYLIKNNEHLLGYSPMEIEVIGERSKKPHLTITEPLSRLTLSEEILALLARHHRKKVPSQKDEDFAKLPEEVQKKVRAMCAVMRVAVALDRCDTSAIQHAHVIQQAESIILAVIPATDLATGVPRDVSLEVWAAQAELPYFEKIFKRQATIMVSDENDLEALSTVAPSASLSS